MTRGEEPTPNHNDIRFDEKESRRWLEAAELAATHLAPVATQVIMVADRGGDIYPMIARRPEAIDFVVRACHNRVLTEGGTLFAAPAAWPAPPVRRAYIPKADGSRRPLGIPTFEDGSSGNIRAIQRFVRGSVARHHSANWDRYAPEYRN